MHHSRALWFVCVLLMTPAFVRGDEVVSLAKAAGMPGKVVTVQMRIKVTGTSTGGFVDLLSEAKPQHPDAFFVRIPASVQEKFKEQKITDLRRHFDQQFIRATGKVKLINYTGIGNRPVIEIEAIDKIAIIDPEALYPVDEAIVDLVKSGKLFQRSTYKETRAVFARRFETNHQADIKKAFGADLEAINRWFVMNPDYKENLYTALLEEDDIPKALAIFKDIWKQYPDTLKTWGQLAIATAVTWDQDQGIYDYQGHQTRVQATMPGKEKMLDALANYKYIVDNEKRFPQQVSLYPWEFLVFVVNHRTPMSEREWAFEYFQVAKRKSKSWHKDVPYDFEIIKREIDKDPSAGKPRMAGKIYTLPNLKLNGGVCAHQADFACRVAKSLGMPAVYCAGASAYRDRHAWWMFVNVASATKDEIKFILQSDGRFDGKDHFYTGDVLDPQTGRLTLDRDMERRLWIAGQDRVGKRLSSLVMRAYPMMELTDSFGTKEKVAYLDHCLKVSKYNEDAWLKFAQLAKKGDLKDENKKVALSRLASLNQTFAGYPDFIWRIFDDLVEVATPSEKIKQYESVIQLFEKAKRPDLVCDARLKLSDLLIQESKFTSAQTGLTATIRKYSTEGRFIPRLMKKIEEVAPNVKGGPGQVAQLYYDIIPAMIIYYRSDSTVYFTKMRSQAKAFFQENNLPNAEATLESRITQARATLTKSKKT